MPSFVVLLIGVGLFAGAAWLSYDTGYDTADALRLAEIEALKSEQSDAIAKQEREHRSTENALRSDLDAIQSEADKLEEAHAQNQRLVADLRAGSRRLSVAVRSCREAGVVPSDPSIAASSGAGAQRAELAAEAAADLVGIATDGDRYIRERNACHAAYAAVRRRLIGAGQ